MPHQRQVLGAAGEARAADWYLERGYDIVERNWRCRSGELDLVLSHGDQVVFCEVKTRRSDAFGAPFEAVTGDKQRRIRRLAAAWIDQAPTRPRQVRFDVASVVGSRVEVIEGAF